MIIKKKYLKKDSYIQKKDKKLLINWDQNSIIMEYKKTVEESGDLIRNKMTRVPKNSLKNNSEIVANENDKEIPKEIDISPEERQKNIDNLRLI